MKKNALILAIAFTVLTIPTMAMAFDFQELDKQISNGEINRSQAKQVIDEAIKKGELTHEQIKQHMEEMRTNFHGKEMRPFGPPRNFRPEAPKNNDFINKLKEAGITKKQMDTAHKKGPDAVMELFKKHGIELSKLDFEHREK